MFLEALIGNAALADPRLGLVTSLSEAAVTDIEYNTNPLQSPPELHDGFH